jgi:hypothetical protein
MRAVFIKAGEQPNAPDTDHPQQRPVLACPVLYWRGARSISLGRTSLVLVQAKSLRSHALDFVIKSVHLLRAPRILGFRRIGAPQFFQRFLDGEFWGFGHGKPHIQAKRCP